MAAGEDAEQARQAEKGQRLQAEAAEKKEHQEREKADTARQAAEDAKRQAEAEQRKFRQLSARLLLEKGQALCEQDDVGRGVLWLARGLETAPADDADLQRVFRTAVADSARTGCTRCVPSSRRRATSTSSPTGPAARRS